MKKVHAAMCAVLLGFTFAGSAYAAERLPGEMIVAMASSRSVCGGNTGKPCPGTAPAPTPPVAASPVIPAPKPLPTPATPTPTAPTTAPSTTPTTTVTPTSATPAPLVSTPTPTTPPTGQASPLGYLDVIAADSHAYGWSYDPDASSQSNTVQIYVDGPAGSASGIFGGQVDADRPRPDVNKALNVSGNHGFDWPIPARFLDGKSHSLYVYGVDLTGNANKALNGSPMAFIPAGSTPLAPAPVTTAPVPAPASTQTLIAITPVPASTPTAGTASLVGLSTDPTASGIGFARAHWASSLNKELVFWGNTNPAGGDNSIRAYDPVKNTWEYLWPNDWKNGGLQNRDNYASFYVPRLDELWIWGGSHLETLPGALCSGRFGVSQRKWITTSTDCYGAFSAVVQNFNGFLIDPGMAWSAQADMGVMFGGSDGGNISNRYWIVEPNPQGPQPYKMSEIIGGVRPPPRAQAMNTLVAVGKGFYLFGGAGVTGFTNPLKDLWKFDTTTRIWSQLPDAPGGSYTPAVTYDSDRNEIVAWVYDKLYVFDIASGQWSDKTTAGLPCVFNQMSVYAPSAKVHLFEGGNTCGQGNYAGSQVYGISLTGTQSPPSSPSTSVPTAPVSSPVSTLTATYRGVTGEDKVGQINQTSANGKADFHVSVSGLRGMPNKLTITSDTGGTWETPFNTQNWIIATQYSGQNGDFWFEQYASNRFHVKVRYADGTTDETDATNQVSPTLAAVAPSPVIAPPAPPTPAPTPAPAATSPASPQPVAGWLNIPLRTWISRPLPPYQLDVRKEFIGQKGYGPGGGGELSGAGGASKHQRLVYNPDNKRVYFYSGDFTGPPFASSFHTDMFSYDLTKYTSDASDAHNWILEWPYCGLPGQITPVHTDEGAFAWDSKRHIFWITAGSEVGGEDVVNMCGNGAIFYGASATSGSNPSGNAQHGFDILQFDPAQNRYIRPDAKYQMIPSSLKGSSQMPRHSVYNPVTDEIFMFGQGISGSVVYRMNAETGVWAVDALVCDAMDSDCSSGHGYLNDVFTVHEQPALDVEHQFIYLIDTYHKQDPDPNHRFRLVRYDIAHHNIVSLGWITLPDFGDPLKFPFYIAPYDSTMLTYDSINKVVLWPASSNEGRPILMIYHPDPTGGKNGNWEIDPMNRDKPNEIVFGSNGTFIPELNALIIFGGFGTPHSDYFADHPGVWAPDNYFWLYRYGNGK
jgi:galactose oxidase-like protein